MGQIIICVLSYLCMALHLFSVYSAAKHNGAPGTILLKAMAASCWSCTGTIWLIRAVKGW